MINEILSTKLFIPSVSSLFVQRMRLMHKLNQALEPNNKDIQKLILVSAPAGFGKTTLVCSWIHNNDLEEQIAWVSLDKGDNELTRFLRHLIAAYQKVYPEIGQQIEAHLASSTILDLTYADNDAVRSIPLEEMLTILVNELVSRQQRGNSGCVLVLDDYHMIQDQNVHSVVSFLVNHLPPKLYVVILTRVDPSLPLSRMRGTNQLIEIRTRDLQFTVDETEIFLNKVRELNLENDQVLHLRERTEGWIVGLQMAAYALQKQESVDAFLQSFRGSHRFILDYLTDEVLIQQPKQVREFMLKTSILNEMCGELCDAVLGNDHKSQLMLEYLDTSNLFVVPLDDERSWYRYHHLFADMLNRRCKTEYHDLVPELHKRASKWYECTGYLDQAISHGVSAGDLNYTVHIVEKHILKVILRGEFVRVRHWLVSIPVTVIRSHPVLCVAKAWVSLRNSELNYVSELIATVKGLIAANLSSPHTSDIVDHEFIANITSHIAVIDVVMTRIKGLSADEQTGIALQGLKNVPKQHMTLRSLLFLWLGLAFLDKGDERASTDAFIQAVDAGKDSESLYAANVAAYCQTVISRRRGLLHTTVAICEDMLSHNRTIPGPEVSNLPVSGIAWIMLGSVYLEWHSLEKAKTALTLGMSLCSLVGLSEVLIKGQYSLTLLSYIEGVPKINIRYDVKRLTKYGTSDLVAYAQALEAQLWILEARYLGITDHNSDLFVWADRQILGIPEQKNADWSSMAQLVYARVLIMQHETNNPSLMKYRLPYLVDYLDQLTIYVEKRGWSELVIEILIVQALALHTMGLEDRAINKLEHALELAVPDGYILIFVKEGLPMVKLLYKVAINGNARSYAGRLLDIMEIDKSSVFVENMKTGSLIEALSDREIEVLELLAQGNTNKEIAQLLIISTGTVKTHTAHIYGKLNAHNRGQAVARARELGIL